MSAATFWCAQIISAAAIVLYGVYRLVMWLADRVIDSLSELTRFE
jgi:hypothetical protein